MSYYLPTKGQAHYINQNINSFIALVFVGTFTLGIGLVVWHASTGHNPIADFIAQTALAEKLSQ